MDITILGIESSCDDTSAAVIRDRTLLSNVIASQAVHQKYGGVIPELASRAHQQNIVPVVDTALKEAGVTIDKIDAIAFTRGPGLLGSLLVGVSFAKGLSISHDIPLVEVNHLQKGQYKALQILVGEHTDSGSILFHLTYTILCIPLTFTRHDGGCFLKKAYSPRHSPSIRNLPKNIRQSNSLPCRFPQIPRLPETTARKTGVIPAPAADPSDTRQ